jgi:hypothetical protein
MNMTFFHRLVILLLVIYEKCSQLKKKSHNHLKSPGIFNTLFGKGIKLERNLILKNIKK